jgi:hypothetical protein
MLGMPASTTDMPSMPEHAYQLRGEERFHVIAEPFIQ